VDVKVVFFAWLRQAHPHLVGEYTTLYLSSSRLPRRYLLEIDSRTRPLIVKRSLPDPDKVIEDSCDLRSLRMRRPVSAATDQGRGSARGLPPRDRSRSPAWATTSC
jgi:hypothetical protein